MSNHYCQVKSISDLLACTQCGTNQICCNLCFSSKHPGQIHKSQKLIDSDIFKNFLRIVHMEWLVGDKIIKSLAGFQLINKESKSFLAKSSFCYSQFYQELFSDEATAQQYQCLKLCYNGNPKPFYSLASLQKILNEARTLDIISKYIMKLTQPTEQEKIMNSHLDFYIGADIYHFNQFIDAQQKLLAQYIQKIFQADSKQNISQQGNFKQGDSKQGDSKQSSSKQKVSQQDDSKQGDSKQSSSKQNVSQQDDSKQGDSKQSSSKQNVSQSDDSKQGDSKQSSSKQGDSKSGNFTQIKFNIYSYIEERQAKVERNPIYYCNEFTAFLVEFYRRKQNVELYHETDYILNYWQFFHIVYQINPTIKRFIESEINLFYQYQQIMQQSNLNISYLGFKIWKLNSDSLKELQYFKNHYFIFAFIEGFIKLKIQRSYAFMTQQEKLSATKQNWEDFAKYIKDFSLYLQQKNKSLKQNQKKILEFDHYRNYYAYRKRLEPFHDKLKSSKQNFYDKELATRFFNHYFDAGIQLKTKFYKQFFQNNEKQKRKNYQAEAKRIELLKQELLSQQKQNFYEFIFLNCLEYCNLQDCQITKDIYQSFKKQTFEKYDEEYIKLTEEKFRRGDFQQQPLQIEQVQQVQKSTLQPKTFIGETGAKIIIGMDKYEEDILENKLHEEQESDEEIAFCACCNGDNENCSNLDCQMMGFCISCNY